MSSATSVSLKVEFSGGLELLFSNKRSHNLSVPALVSSTYGDTASENTKPADITFLIHHLRDSLLKERVELFMENGTVYVHCLWGTFYDGRI
jgi:ubiquitin related modifier 1